MPQKKEQLLDKQIELFFFDPRKTKEEYGEFYKEVYAEKFEKEKLCRYSPLFHALRDIRFCFGVGKEFNLIRDNLNFPEFAGIVIIDLAFYNLVKKVYKGPFGEYAQKYMKIDSKEEIESLRRLRNAIQHGFYSLKILNKETGNEEFFTINNSLDKAIHREAVTENNKTTIKNIINSKKLYSDFTESIILFKNDLLNHNNKKRACFSGFLNIDNWIYNK